MLQKPRVSFFYFFLLPPDMNTNRPVAVWGREVKGRESSTPDNFFFFYFFEETPRQLAAAVWCFDLLWRSDPISEIYLALVTSKKKQLRLGGGGRRGEPHSHRRQGHLVVLPSNASRGRQYGPPVAGITLSHTLQSAGLHSREQNCNLMRSSASCSRGGSVNDMTKKKQQLGNLV